MLTLSNSVGVCFATHFLQYPGVHQKPQQPRDKRLGLGCIPTCFNPKCLMTGKKVPIKTGKGVNRDHLSIPPSFARI